MSGVSPISLTATSGGETQVPEAAVALLGPAAEARTLYTDLLPATSASDRPAADGAARRAMESA